MRQHIYILVIAALALMINSVCLCAAATPGCTPLCAALEYNGTCPAHQRHQNSRGGQQCCQTAACSSPGEIRADTDSHAANYFRVSSSLAIRAPILDLATVAAGLVPLTEAHLPPLTVPVFLAIRTLVL